jgi:hypothetical protein
MLAPTNSKITRGKGWPIKFENDASNIGIYYL